MGMSTHVVGFIEQTEHWKKYKQAWDACLDAGVPVPREILDYFGGEYPKGTSKEFDLKKASYVREYKADMIEGFEIRVDEIPKSMKVIRFYNSW